MVDVICFERWTELDDGKCYVYKSSSDCHVTHMCMKMMLNLNITE